MKLKPEQIVASIVNRKRRSKERAQYPLTLIELMDLQVTVEKALARAIRGDGVMVTVEELLVEFFELCQRRIQELQSRDEVSRWSDADREEIARLRAAMAAMRNRPDRGPSFVETT